jgi:hypothetical protein
MCTGNEDDFNAMRGRDYKYLYIVEAGLTGIPTSSQYETTRTAVHTTSTE